jgi:hypothetical protein
MYEESRGRALSPEFMEQAKAVLKSKPLTSTLSRTNNIRIHEQPVSSGSSAISEPSLIYVTPKTVSDSSILSYDDFSILLDHLPGDKKENP